MHKLAARQLVALGYTAEVHYHRLKSDFKLDKIFNFSFFRSITVVLCFFLWIVQHVLCSEKQRVDIRLLNKLRRVINKRGVLVNMKFFSKLR